MMSQLQSHISTEMDKMDAITAQVKLDLDQIPTHDNEDDQYEVFYHNLISLYYINLFQNITIINSIGL